MKALALLGSLAVAIYVIVFLVATWVNISKAMFGRGWSRYGFATRQFMIVFWPLMLFSREGRDLFAFLWKGEDYDA